MPGPRHGVEDDRPASISSHDGNRCIRSGMVSGRMVTRGEIIENNRIRRSIE